MQNQNKLSKNKIINIIRKTKKYLYAKEPFPDPIKINQEQIDHFEMQIMNNSACAELFLTPFRSLLYKNGIFILCLFEGPYDEVDDLWAEQMQEEFKEIGFIAVQGPYFKVLRELGL